MIALSLSLRSIPKRTVLAVLLAATIGGIFWVSSRYPALLHEAARAQLGTLTDRHLGLISKDEVMRTGMSEPVWLDIGKTTVNWLATNRAGMIFGIAFGAALLTLLNSDTALAAATRGSALTRALAGIGIGAPLGVCANCVTPIALALQRRRAPLETILAAMISSPTLNVVALVMTFVALPLAVASARLAAILVLILACVPWIARHSRLAPITPSPTSQVDASQPWRLALGDTLMAFARNLLKLSLALVPLMAIAGVLGATLIVLVPAQTFINANWSPWLVVPLASVFGALLPMPMLVDLIMVVGLSEAGLSSSVAAALLVALPSMSVLSLLVLTRYFSWRPALYLFGSVALVSTVTGAGLQIGNALLAPTPAANPNLSSCAATATPVFRDATAESGLVVNEPGLTSFPGGLVAADFLGHGVDDIYFVGQLRGYLFANDGHGHFADVTAKSGIASYPNGMGALAADFDNDGREDLLLYGNNVPLKLYRNLGDGHFEDATAAMGLPTRPLYAFAATAGDYDHDGWLDLYVAGAFGVGEPAVHEPTNVARLFHNVRGHFEDVTNRAGVGNPGKAFSATFLTRPDGWSDLLVANDFGPNALFHNNGDGTFSDGSSTLPQLPPGGNNGMGIALGDFLGHGQTDAYLTNIYKPNSTAPAGNQLLTQQAGAWVNQAHAVGVDDGGWMWGAVAVDYRDTGRQAIAGVAGWTGQAYPGLNAAMNPAMVTSRSVLFEAQSDGAFRDVASCAGFANVPQGRGIIAADLQNRGYPDLIVSDMAQHLRLFQNAGGANHWLRLKLVGSQSNRDGIGARVLVERRGGQQFQELETGGSYGSSGDLSLLFGLGAQTTADRVTIWWPSGLRQQLTHVSADQRITVTEPAR